ncbi:alpha-N-acetyl-neuraminyl-2,3-beta-galactosyl-1,3-N-acetyl-galactosaminide alpha-2,6-sialyltransferase-like [Antedon mediterranea]|uniref:alpha-N-acetyl-neuraminyl-2,3-beta-galactosyl-1, 3-N-acetyl-galactosaminide alpha-2,6-sialyltransferase-like n=1 Tax=Antedon mediterranea TaxID=105859 RepID=UPI003AF9B514
MRRFYILLTVGALCTCFTFYYINRYGKQLGSPVPVKANLRQENKQKIQKLEGIDKYVTIDQEEMFALRCNKCAIISNSGRLLKTGAGREIDETECVIRMNTSPTKGFEQDVGSKTTIRVIGHANLKKLQSMPAILEEFFRVPKTKTKHLIVAWLYMTHVNKTSNPHYKATRILSKMYPSISFYVPTLESMQKAELIFKKETGITRKNAKTWFTTGWLTMLLAIATCKNIAVYGMLEHHHCQNHMNDPTLYHYYNPKDGKECQYYKRSEESLAWGHLFITEKAIFENWAKQAPITFHHPFWNISGTSSSLLDTPFITKYRYRYKHFQRFSKLGTIPNLHTHAHITSQSGAFQMKVILIVFCLPFLFLMACICCF